MKETKTKFVQELSPEEMKLVSDFRLKKAEEKKFAETKDWAKKAADEYIKRYDGMFALIGVGIRNETYNCSHIYVYVTQINFDRDGLVFDLESRKAWTRLEPKFETYRIVMPWNKITDESHFELLDPSRESVTFEFSDFYNSNITEEYFKFPEHLNVSAEEGCQLHRVVLLTEKEFHSIVNSIEEINLKKENLIKGDVMKRFEKVNPLDSLFCS